MLASSLAYAQPEARSPISGHVEKATAFHNAGMYIEALAELEAAYKLEPQPSLLFAIAQTHVKLGNCPLAIEYYMKFLDTNPTSGATAAKQAIEVCKFMPSQRPQDSTPEAKPDEKPSEPKPIIVVERDEPRPFYKDWIGNVLVLAGVASGIVGGIEYASARTNLDRAETAISYSEHASFVADARGDRLLAIAFGAGGAALVIAGVVHYAVSGGSKTTDSAAIAPTAHGGAMVTWARRF
jgi:tetratricopeptide (TPR) repeat protein